MKTMKTTRLILSTLVIGMALCICSCSDNDDTSGENGGNTAGIITTNIEASSWSVSVIWSGPRTSIQIDSSLNLFIRSYENDGTGTSNSEVSYIGQVQKITDIVHIPTVGYAREASAIVNGGYVIRAFDSDENKYKYLRFFILAAQNSIYTVQYQEFGN